MLLLINMASNSPTKAVFFSITMLFFFIFLGVILAYSGLTDQPMTEYTIVEASSIPEPQRMKDDSVSRVCYLRLRPVEEPGIIRTVPYYSPPSYIWIGGAQDHVFQDIVVGNNIWVIDAGKYDPDQAYDGDVIVAELYTEHVQSRQTHEKSLLACSGVFGGLALIFFFATLASS